MTRNEQIENQANRIADAIVDLVERSDGPVTLAQIDREISGFASNEGPIGEYFFKHDRGVRIVWNGMTEAGMKALRKVIRGRKVAVQLVNVLPYILEGYAIHDERWMPIVLLPARAANLETPAFPLLRAARQHQFVTQATAEKRTGNGLLTAGSVRSTADCFSPL